MPSLKHVQNWSLIPTFMNGVVTSGHSRWERNWVKNPSLPGPVWPQIHPLSSSCRHGSRLPHWVDLHLNLVNEKCWWKPRMKEEGINHGIASSLSPLASLQQLCLLCGSRSHGMGLAFALGFVNTPSPFVSCPRCCRRFLLFINVWHGQMKQMTLDSATADLDPVFI